MQYVKKGPGSILLLGVLTWLLIACAQAGPADSNAMSATAPALLPAPSHTAGLLATKAAAVPLATNTPDPNRPPTGTPIPLPLSQAEPTATGQIQAAAPTLVPTTGPVPTNPLEQAADIERPSLVADLDCEAEIEAYQEHLTSDPALATYEAQVVADCYLEQGDRPAAIELYLTAIEDGADRITEVVLRQGLAELLVEEDDYPAALTQYETILTLAETEVTRSRTLYQAGQTELLAGDLEAGFARFLTLINDYPAADPSYQALNELLAAGYTVDDYQQGQIAYSARSYDVAAAAFRRAVEANPDQNGDAYLYLAWSLEKLGDIDGALAQIDAHVADYEAAGYPAQAARGRIERAKLQTRAGRTVAALDDYQAYLARYPQGEEAPLAAWQSASLAEALGYLTLAGERYLAFAESYPDRHDTAEALFRAGLLLWRLDEQDDAFSIWQRAVDAYPEQEYGAASLLWLIRNAPAGDAGRLAALATNISGQSYYAQRVRHLLNSVEPFVSAGAANLYAADTGRDFAESWLREWLGLDGQHDVASLSNKLVQDARLVRGNQLWQLGRRREATALFESLRSEYATDALASYQLALYFRDLGLYRSSLLAATTVMYLAGVGVSGAPRFLARLAYPAYHADLVSAEAQSYGFDPLLQLALIREESFFDTLATSAAGARGLSQILPETGSYIAGQLGWPGYTAGDLYRPEVAIPFGAYFLDQQLERYDGNAAAALAAYNAGPDFADGWYDLESDDFDLFLETVDFPETQRYIKQIYTVHVIYRFLYS